MGEFELIRRYFQRPTTAPGITLGNGDDCALLSPVPGMAVAISTDMLVEGRHFFADVDPHALGHKALAVNLSDLAAMGAEPLAFTLALSLPSADEHWLERFSNGLWAVADQHHCPLIGGDTTRGPLNLCITVLGQVPARQGLLRSAAQPNDDIYVSGQVGDARLALELLRGSWNAAPDVLDRTRQRLERPTPRLRLGQALRGIAHAAADVSDGLLADLRHILDSSGLSADVWPDALLASPAVSDDVRALPTDQALTCALAGGDDYELVFTAPPHAREAVAAASQRSGTPVTRIGTTRAHNASTPTVRLLDRNGSPLTQALTGFDHFA